MFQINKVCLWNKFMNKFTPIAVYWLYRNATSRRHHYRIEKKKKEQERESVRDEPKKKPKPSSISTGPKLDMVNYKTMAGSTQYKFGVLAKIVKHMKARHQDGDDHPLTLEEILDETNQLDVGSKVSANFLPLISFIIKEKSYILLYLYLGQTMASNGSSSKKSQDWSNIWW